MDISARLCLSLLINKLVMSVNTLARSEQMTPSSFQRHEISRVRVNYGKTTLKMVARR